MRFALERYWGKERTKVLVGNFTSLLSVRMINIIQPLIVLPYLTRTLGPEKFGLIAFAQSFIEYFNVLIEYGFNLTATRSISINRNDKDKINSIFSNVLITKNILYLVSIVILIAIVFLNEEFISNWRLFIYTSGMLFGNVLFPIWFFQGIERMKYISILNISAKLFFTICIFLFVRGPEDFLLVPFFNSLGYISIGIISLFIIYSQFKIRINFPTLSNIRQTLGEGSSVFISNLAPNLYNNSSVFILGLYTSNIVTGYFSGMVKITGFFNTVLNVISQTFFPFLAKERSSFKKFIVLMLSTGLIMSILVFSFRGLLVNFLLGQEFLVTKKYLMVFSISIYQISLINGFRNYLLIQYKDRLLRNINIIISIIGFFIVLLMIKYFGIWGSIIGLVATRFILSSTYLYSYRKINKKTE